MTTEEIKQKIEKFLEEEKIDWQSLHLYIMDKGYVILTEEEYNEEFVED